MIERLEIVAAHYSGKQDLPVLPVNFAEIRSDPVVGVRIAAAYLKAPMVSPDALPAYRALREETLRQLDHLIKHARLELDVAPDDPYHDVEALRAELREGKLRIWSTASGGNPHPYLSDDDNDAFRAVHDAFGHGATGCGFDRHGEEGAWRKHSQMYSPLARQAMTTETRGQTCMFVYGNDNQYFSEQKAIILPAEFWA